LLAVQQPIARSLLPGASAMAGAAELLQRCRSLGVAMAMVTSSAREAVALKTAPHPWLDCIGLRILGDDEELAAGKPAPDPYLLAARRLGLPPQRCWAFEDSLAGALSARAAGCRVHVLLPPGASPQEYPSGVTILQSLREVCLDAGTHGADAA
jgi:HAD superfamily hydrolase (TIGR01509 family)